MPPGKHAVLGPSKSHIYMHCTPAPRLEERLREKLGPGAGDSSFAAEGTKAHELAEIKLRRLTGEINDYNYAGRREELEARAGPIDKEMDEATDYYVSIVIERLMEARRYDPNAKLLIEVRVDISTYAPHCHGTSDAIVVSRDALEVIDLKYGKGVPVSAVGNSQARMYALGAHELLGPDYGFALIRTTIVQPRLDNVSTEELTRAELIKWGLEELRPAALLAWDGKGEFHPGEWCQFCLARPVCLARAIEAMHIFATGLSDPAILADEDIPDILAYAKAAKQWIADLEKYAEAQAIGGKRWPGYKLVRGRSNRIWSDEEALVQNLVLAGYKREDLIKSELRSVAEIEKLLGPKAFRAFAEQFSLKPEGKLTLAPESDKRLEVSLADADFGDLGDINNK